MSDGANVHTEAEPWSLLPQGERTSEVLGGRGRGFHFVSLFTFRFFSEVFYFV